MSKDSIRQFTNLLAALLALTVNVLAVVLPLNGRNTADISNLFPVYFVPAGYVFSIWGVIYLGWLAFVVFQFRPSHKKSPRLRALGYLFALSCLLNGAWLFCWHYLQFGLSVLVMLALLSSLIAAYLKLDVARLQVGPLERWSLDIPFSLYLGWITVATVANISDYLYFISWNGWGIDPRIWAVIMLAVASLLGLAVAVSRKDSAYLLVLVWAFIGIAIRQSAAASVARAAWVAAMLALALAAWTVVVRRRGARRVLQAP